MAIIVHVAPLLAVLFTTLEAFRTKTSGSNAELARMASSYSMLFRGEDSTATTGMNCARTGYDKLLSMARGQKLMDKDDTVYTNKTVLIVVDTQLGFTANHDDLRHGGFHQPCLAADSSIPGVSKHKAAIDRIVQEINSVKKANGIIVATKDYHPADHCSFLRPSDPHPCRNSPGAANSYATKAYGSHSLPTGYPSNRYQNTFPVHCVGTVSGIVEKGEHGDMIDGENYEFNGTHPAATLPALQTETNLDGKVWNAMKDYERSYVAYKGFHRSYESFGAFPMEGEAKDAYNAVGAKVWKGKHGAALENHVNPPAAAFGDIAQNFEPLEDFLKAQKVDAVRVVGYVYDFCVKETAIGAVQQGFTDTTVIMDATRPAVDGLTTDDEGKVPGLAGVFDSGATDCVLGSYEASVRAFFQLKQNGVKQV